MEQVSNMLDYRQASVSGQVRGCLERVLGVMIGWQDSELAIQGISLTVNSDQKTQHQRWKTEDLKLTKKTIQPYP